MSILTGSAGLEGARFRGSLGIETPRIRGDGADDPTSRAEAIDNLCNGGLEGYSEY